MTARTSFRLRDIHDRTDRACIGADTELFFVGGDDPDLLEPARDAPLPLTACLSTLPTAHPRAANRSGAGRYANRSRLAKSSANE